MNRGSLSRVLLAVGAVVFAWVAFAMSVDGNSPFPWVFPAALLGLPVILDLRSAQQEDVLRLERRAFGALKWTVLPVAIGLCVGSLVYQPAWVHGRFMVGQLATTWLSFFIAWPVIALLGRLLVRRASDGTRWRRAAWVGLVGLACASAAVVTRAAGVGWTELPAFGTSVTVGGGRTMRQVIRDDSAPSEAPAYVIDAAGGESLRPPEEGGGAAMIIELAGEETRQYEALRGRRAWVAARRAHEGWRVCTGAPATGPCIDVTPEGPEANGPHAWHQPARQRRVVGDIPRSWLLFSLLGALAALALLRAAARERSRWRSAREGEHTGDGSVRWPDGAIDQVPNARQAPAGPVTVREHGRSAASAYRGGSVIDGEVWPGPLAPRLRLAAGRADVLNALALVVIAHFGAPLVAALWAVW
jgi:hypothetical protein